MFPPIVEGMRARKLNDNSYFLPREPSKETLAQLDKQFLRVEGGLRWREQMPESYQIEDLRPIFQQSSCNIVGKGPSLDRLRRQHLVDGPVLCINDSIHHVESICDDLPIFMVQQDAFLKDTCRPRIGKAIVSRSVLPFYDLNEIIPYDPEQFHASTHTLTVIIAIKIGQRLDVARFFLHCFDACVTGDTDYAKCIGYRPSVCGHSPSRFISHKQRIEDELKNSSFQWTKF